MSENIPRDDPSEADTGDDAPLSVQTTILCGEDDIPRVDLSPLAFSIPHELPPQPIVSLSSPEMAKQIPVFDFRKMQQPKPRDTSAAQRQRVCRANKKEKELIRAAAADPTQLRLVLTKERDVVAAPKPELPVVCEERLDTLRENMGSSRTSKQPPKVANAPRATVIAIALDVLINEKCARGSWGRACKAGARILEKNPTVATERKIGRWLRQTINNGVVPESRQGCNHEPGVIARLMDPDNAEQRLMITTWLNKQTIAHRMSVAAFTRFLAEQVPVLGLRKGNPLSATTVRSILNELGWKFARVGKKAIYMDTHNRTDTVVNRIEVVTRYRELLPRVFIALNNGIAQYEPPVGGIAPQAPVPNIMLPVDAQLLSTSWANADGRDHIEFDLTSMPQINMEPSSSRRPVVIIANDQSTFQEAETHSMAWVHEDGLRAPPARRVTYGLWFRLHLSWLHEH